MNSTTPLITTLQEAMANLMRVAETSIEGLKTGIISKKYIHNNFVSNSNRHKNLLDNAQNQLQKLKLQEVAVLQNHDTILNTTKLLTDNIKSLAANKDAEEIQTLQKKLTAQTKVTQDWEDKHKAALHELVKYKEMTQQLEERLEEQRSQLVSLQQVFIIGILV